MYPHDGSEGADGKNKKLRISGERIPDGCMFDVVGLGPSVD
jgi:hypothetical protein